ncbi:MAG: hypothetical protein ACYDAG_02815 [Chloroflexota bacterium]
MEHLTHPGIGGEPIDHTMGKEDHDAADSGHDQNDGRLVRLVQNGDPLPGTSLVTDAAGGHQSPSEMSRFQDLGGRMEHRSGMPRPAA